jgi:hypothetical protein
LVKLSGNVPAIGVVENIAGEPGTEGTLIEIAFSREHTLMMPEAEFVGCWYNTEWFTLIPSSHKAGGQLMEMKLRAAVTRQCHSLRSGYGSVVTGSAVLEYLKDELMGKSGRYRDPATHSYLWQRARGIVGLRRRYAAAMDHLAFAAGAAASLKKGLEAWEELYAVLDGDLRHQELAGVYDMLMARENEMAGHFKAIA